MWGGSMIRMPTFDQLSVIFLLLLVCRKISIMSAQHICTVRMHDNVDGDRLIAPFWILALYHSKHSFCGALA